MNRGNLIAVTILSASALLAGCGTPNYGNNASAYPTSYPSNTVGAPAATAFGVVESIQSVNTGTSSSSGINAGTVVGGVVGGLLGNQVGGGTGRGLATAAGVVGGALAGNQIQKNTQAPGTAYQVGVRLDNGAFQTVTQDSVADLSVGSRVRLDNGRVYRY